MAKSHQGSLSMTERDMVLEEGKITEMDTQELWF